MMSISSMNKLDMIVQISQTDCKIPYSELKLMTKKELIDIYYKYV